MKLFVNTSFVIVLFWITNSFGFAQSKQDSLLSIWENSALDDTTRINSGFKYIQEAQLSLPPQKLVVIAEEILVLSEEQGLKKLEVDALLVSCELQILLSKIDDAMQFCVSGLELAKELGYVLGEMKALNHLGSLWAYKFKPDSALAVHKQVLELATKQNDSAMLARSTFNIGHSHAALWNLKKAQIWIEKSLVLSEKMDLKNGMFHAFTSLGDINYRLKNYPKSIKYLNHALNLSEGMNKKYFTAQTHFNLGELYYEILDLSQAEYHYSKAMELYIELNLLKEKRYAQERLSKVKAVTNESKNAIQTYLDGLDRFYS